MLEKFLNGVKINYTATDDVYRIYKENGSFIGLGEIKENILKRDVIL